MTLYEDLKWRGLSKDVVGEESEVINHTQYKGTTYG